MIPLIDKEETGRKIKKYMSLRGFTVKEVRKYLSLGSVQSVYHWLDGQNMPSLDNLYALSELLQVQMDLLVVGNRTYQPQINLPSKTLRMLFYYNTIYKCIKGVIFT